MTQVIEPQQADFVPVKDQTYTLPWRYLSAAEHRVELRDEDELVARLLTRGVDYTISPQGDTPVGSGTLTLLATPTTAEVKLVVAHDTTPDQNYSAVPGAEAIERQLDRFSHKFQQLDDRLNGNLSLVDRARRWAIEKDGTLVDDEDFSSKAYAGRSKASSNTAINAADVAGVDLFVDTYAEAEAALAGLSEGDVVDIGADETRGDYRTRYRVEGGALVFKIQLEPYRIYDTVTDLLDSVEQSRGLGAIWKGRTFWYEEVANGEHVIKLGGVKLKVLPDRYCNYHAAALGPQFSGAKVNALLQTASAEGGGVVVLPISDVRLPQGDTTIVVPRSCGLVGAALDLGGQRGGGVINHPTCLHYTGTGSAIKFEGPGVNCRISGFSIVSEPADDNYQNFKGVEFNVMARGRADEIYVEGANVGFDFSCSDGNINGCSLTNLAAHGCATFGFKADFVSSSAAPFFQACLLTVREASACGTAGIYIGNGQQNHNTLRIEGGQVGGNGIGILLDDNESGTCHWQLWGNAWLEQNTNGNIVVRNTAVLYVGGDITGSDNNITGGFITEGEGRIIPLGRSSFDNYSFAFTGFPSKGLARAWSFVDEGGNNFHCPITGAKAEISGTATKVSANTRFSDGVASFAGGNGVRVRDETFNWTADWTLAVLVYRPASATVGDVLHVQKNSGPSILRWTIGTSTTTLITRDAGATAVSASITMTHNNARRAPVWVVLSYDASETKFTVHTPNGRPRQSITRAVPPALTAGNYDNFSVTGSIASSDLVIDEFILYNRVLSADEIMAINELQTNVVGAIGRDPRDGIARKGSVSATTDANGEVTFVHGLLDTPIFAAAEIIGDNANQAKIKNISATNITVVIVDSSGSEVASAAVSFVWRAEV